MIKAPIASMAILDSGGNRGPAWSPNGVAVLIWDFRIGILDSAPNGLAICSWRRLDGAAGAWREYGFFFWHR